MMSKKVLCTMLIYSLLGLISAPYGYCSQENYATQVITGRLLASQVVRLYLFTRDTHQLKRLPDQATLE